MSESVSTPANPTRRGLVVGAVAATALAAGAGAAWWRLRPHDVDAQALDTLWAASFPTLDGPPLAMAALRGRPLLVNFWATWCPPCVEEMPLLDSFFRQQATNGFQVVGLAVDQADPVRRFLARTPVAFPIALAGLGGVDLSRSLGNQVGGLPFTVVLDADGNVRERRMGQVSEDDLKAWARRT